MVRAPHAREDYLLNFVFQSDSDSDSSIEHLTNRGNKLRKKARFVHEGQLAPPTGPLVYKKVGHYFSRISLLGNSLNGC
jgi:hypothetical protein